jgi:hypothetical protein
MWTQMSATKSALMTRCERYAQLTIPKICLRDGFVPESTDQAHDFQSVGAQALNHATNKAMMVLFPPSRPFFVLEPDAAVLADLAQAGADANDLSAIFASKEQEATRYMQASGQRNKLHTAVKHLICTGNVLLDLSEQEMRVMGLRYFCVKRTVRGKLYRLVICESVQFDELDPDIQALIQKKPSSPEHKVSLYKWVQRMPNGDYTMSQWVDEQRLPQAYNGKWSEVDLPFHALAWDLADESDYGTGLVEEYVGDFEALSGMAESVVGGAILALEQRWLVNPTGMTQPEDLNNSKNGDALPGVPADVAPTQGGNPQAVLAGLEVLNRWEQRIARGFLLLSAIRRDAERVTAEELRQDAQELETAWGGVYSMLGVTLQKPVARWALRGIDMDIKGTKLEATPITGLDALGRNSELDKLRYAFGDLASAAAVPPQLQNRIKWGPLGKFVGAGRGIDLAPFIMSDQEFAQAMQAAQQARVDEATMTAAGTSAGEQVTQGTA